MPRDKDKDQDSITVYRGVARRFRSYKRRLNFATNTEFLDALLRMISTLNLDKYQIYSYGSELTANITDAKKEEYIPEKMPTPQDFGISEKREKE